MICPDNSTECLLRAFIDAKHGFNWDPLNFAFTAATGILALLIACIAIFQGLLAAGPGRLKASRSAIGPWSAKSKSNFDWVELGLRTTAEVPYLQGGPDGALPPKQLGSVFPQIKSAEAAATWLTLLQRAGLANPAYWETKSIATDYLPGDIQAAPASAAIAVLVLLALSSDNDMIIDYKLGSRFVRVQGRASQLTIRDHPILGPVAVYETYGDAQSQTPPSPEAARDSMTFARGIVTCGGLIIRTEVYLRSMAEEGIKEPFQNKRIVMSELRDAWPLSWQAVKLKEWAQGTSKRSWGLSLSPKHCSNVCLTAFLLLVGDVPIGLQSNFPFRCMKAAILKLMEILRCIVPPLASPGRDVVIKIEAATASAGLQSQANTSTTIPVKLNSWVSLSESAPQQIWGNDWFESGIFLTCLQWTHELERDKNARYRSISRKSWTDPDPNFQVINQLAQLDAFINRFYKVQADAIAERLLFEILRAEDDPNAQSTLIQSSEDENVATLLCLRIVLYAAILDMCVDTSFLYMEEFKDSVVKIL